MISAGASGSVRNDALPTLNPFMNQHFPRKSWSQHLHRLPLIILSLFLLLPAHPAHAIGLKILQSFHDTPLSSAKTWDICVAGDQFLFFAAQDGLIQYDGAGYKLFPLNNRYSLRSVSADTIKNRIYASGINEFGYFTPSATKSLEYVCLSDSLGRARHIGNVWGIYSNGDQVIAQGDMALAFLNEKDGSYEVIGSPDKLDCSAMVDGVLWLGTDAGLKFLMGKSIVDAPGAGMLKGKRIRAILPFGKDMLIVTAADGIFRYDRNLLIRLEAASQAACALGDIFSADVRDNTLALGTTDNGIGIIDLTSGSMKVYNEASGLDNNTVLAIRFDHHGDVWAGLDPGTVKISLTLPVETFSHANLPFGSGYMIAVKGDRMYLAANQGLYYVHYIPGADLSRTEFHKVEGISGQVWAIRKIGEDLFCCADRGLYLLEGNAVQPIDGVSGAWDIQPWISDRDRAYVGTYQGFQVLRRVNGKWQSDRQLGGYNSSSYNFVQESPSFIWSDDGEEGIYRIEIDTAAMRAGKIYNFKETSDGLPLTSDVSISRVDNDIIISTLRGIYRYDHKTGKIIPDDKLAVLLDTPRSVNRVKKERGWQIGRAHV